MIGAYHQFFEQEQEKQEKSAGIIEGILSHLRNQAESP
jgi:hypothetical protein